MKIRSGFVSNSSASSFIMGIARTEDPEKLKSFIDKHKEYIDSGELWLYSSLELMLSHHEDYYYKKENNHIIIPSFKDNIEVKLPLSKLKENSMVVAFEITGEHDENEVWDEDSGCYRDQLELSQYSDGAQSLFNDLNEENGFKDIQKTHGCGRDG